MSPIESHLLTGPLPWDGVLVDQDGTPTTSPTFSRAFIAPSSKRRRSRLSRIKQELDLNGRSQSAPVDVDLQAHLAQLPKNELGATWLDKFGEKILTIDFKKREQRRKSALQGEFCAPFGESLIIPAPAPPLQNLEDYLTSEWGHTERLRPHFRSCHTRCR